MLHNRVLLMMSVAATVLSLSPTVSAQNTTSPSQRDRKFVRSALEGENAEVALGHLAVQKADSADIKQFGQKIIDDQTTLGDQIRKVARKEGVVAPPGATSKNKGREAKLKVLSGPAFDKAYIEAVEKDQRACLDEFNAEANRGNDTEIKDAASQGALLIGENLKLAEAMSRNHNLRGAL